MGLTRDLPAFASLFAKRKKKKKNRRNTSSSSSCKECQTYILSCLFTLPCICICFGCAIHSIFDSFDRLALGASDIIVIIDFTPRLKDVISLILSTPDQQSINYRPIQERPRPRIQTDVPRQLHPPYCIAHVGQHSTSYPTFTCNTTQNCTNTLISSQPSSSLKRSRCLPALSSLGRAWPYKNRVQSPPPPILCRLPRTPYPETVQLAPRTRPGVPCTIPSS